MLDDIRSYVRAGLEALSGQSTEDATAAVRSRGKVMAEQLSSLATGFLEWSAEARASMLREVKDVVARQVQEMGVATGPDLEALRARVDELQARVDELRARVARSSSRGAGARPASDRKAASKAGGARSSATKASSRARGASRTGGTRRTSGSPPR